MKEKTTPLMVEKTGLTKEQADKVIELNFEMRMAAGALRILMTLTVLKKLQN
jgi:hypothetical protein